MRELFDLGLDERQSGSALISNCGRYRYSLHRRLRNGSGKVCAFIMLNPSTADALIDDPTIRRCMAFTLSWGFSVLSVADIFALRATDPRELVKADDPVGPLGDTYIRSAATADLVVCAWGAGGALLGRDKQVLELLAGRKLHCLKLTKNGHPQHPLYVRGDTQSAVFREGR